MRVEYNRMACAAWFQCIQKWDEFDMNMGAGKADLNGAEETDDGIFEREVPEDAEQKAIDAAHSCPIDAIIVYDDDGTQVAPEP
ncbi:ferredoxin [Natronobiforma cellulositropha]|uniref:ferredoxin n=1 Tax=Natronobiforma cellulositropha TaxID=1679076 RepID=UPI0021D59F78|nr:ferredoxin [Natronobiforma cellulositropha]